MVPLWLALLMTIRGPSLIFKLRMYLYLIIHEIHVSDFGTNRLRPRFAEVTGL